MSDTTARVEAEEQSIPPERRKELLTVVREWAAVTITVMVLLGGFAGFVLQSAHAQTVDAISAAKADAGAQVKRLDTVEASLERHITEEAAAREAISRKLEAAEERNARRFEALYNAVLERRPQPGAEELTKPARDGGGQ